MATQQTSPGAEPNSRRPEVRANVISIGNVPVEELPDGLPQLVLVALAYQGYDVRCYKSGGPRGTWVVWLDQLAAVRPDRDGRVTLRDWRRTYRRLLVEMGYTADDADVEDVVEEVQRA